MTLRVLCPYSHFVHGPEVCELWDLRSGIFASTMASAWRRLSNFSLVMKKSFFRHRNMNMNYWHNTCWRLSIKIPSSEANFNSVIGEVSNNFILPKRKQIRPFCIWKFYIFFHSFLIKDKVKKRQAPVFPQFLIETFNQEQFPSKVTRVFPWAAGHVT